MDLERRLKALEESKARHRASGPGNSPRQWERFFHLYENARRELYGREPMPDLPYLKEDYEDDLNMLNETIPAYRESLGWQTEEAREFLDYWESEVRERLEREAEHE